MGEPIGVAEALTALLDAIDANIGRRTLLSHMPGGRRVEAVVIARRILPEYEQARAALAREERRPMARSEAVVELHLDVDRSALLRPGDRLIVNIGERATMEQVEVVKEKLLDLGLEPGQVIVCAVKDVVVVERAAGFEPPTQADPGLDSVDTRV